MKFIRPQDKSVFVILVKRTVFFFFGLCVLILFLYGIGTNQGFMDITQIMLLRLAVTVGLCLGVASCYGIILDLWLLVRGKFRRSGGIGFYIILGCLGIAVAVLVTFILVIIDGNAGGGKVV